VYMDSHYSPRHQDAVPGEEGVQSRGVWFAKEEGAEGMKEGVSIEEADCPEHVSLAAEEHLAVLNTIILITGKYFGQQESYQEAHKHEEECDDDDDDCDAAVDGGVSYAHDEKEASGVRSSHPEEAVDYHDRSDDYHYCIDEDGRGDY
jgi:hypothetical protein